jgi:mannose-1-phosphate guanylyltransferase
MMLEETIDRVLPIIPIENIRIVTGETMKNHILNSISSLNKDNIISEPEGKNTCVAIGLASVHLLKNDPDAVMIVLSADHLIRPAERLLNILQAGADIASMENHLITIGIVPTRPETAYGYIKLGDMYKQEGDHVVYRVSAFTEKPKAAVASQYYFSREYLWNSGMFIWSAKSIMNAIAKCQPELHKLLEKYSGDIGTPRELKAREDLYQKTISISIDFAVLELAANVLTIKADIIWDDIGGWLALERYKDRDRDNNVIIGDASLVDTYETTVYNEGEGIITCLGISDMVVVQSGNITLVVHKTKADNIKNLLARLSEDEKTRQYL